MVIVNKDGRIVLVNAQTEKLFGYTREELVGQPVEMLVPERFRRRIPRHRAGLLRRPAAARDGLGLELFGLRKDGTEFPVEISLSPLETEEGMLVSGAIRDITERKRLECADAGGQPAEERVPRQHVARAAHAAQRHHRLRRADAQRQGRAASRRAPGVPRRHPDQLAAPAAADQRRARPGQGRVGQDGVPARAGRPRAADRARCGTSCAAWLRRSTCASRSTSTRRCARSSSTRPLKQVLYNYLSNAIKFTPEGGRVVVRVAAEGPTLFRIEVEDTGIGIPPEELGKLFVEFQQLDASAAKRYQGTGLGLALTKRIVEAQGGRVAVRSTPSQGSTFSAILPRTMPRDMPGMGRRTTPRLNGRRADPDRRRQRQNLKLARVMLATEGYDVRTATDAEEALALLRTSSRTSS